MTWPEKTLGRTYKELMDNKKVTDEAIEKSMLAAGTHLNRGKEETVVRGPFTEVVQIIKQDIAASVTHARYLGSRYAEQHSLSEECVFRLQAMRKAWSVLYRFLTGGAILKFRLVIFLCCIYNTALSGLEAYATRTDAPLGRELAPMQKLIAHYLRSMLKGEATVRTTLIDAEGMETTSYRSLSNDWVYRRCGIVPLHLTLRIRRILWLQTMLRAPDHHQLCLSAIFGEVKGEPAPYEIDGTISSRASPWLRQAEADLMAMSGIDQMATVIEDCTNDKGKLEVQTLLMNFREELVECDPHELQARALSMAIPRYLSQDAHGENGEDDEFAGTGRHVCDLCNDNGETCGLRFKTIKALLTHASSKKQGWQSRVVLQIKGINCKSYMPHMQIML